MYQTIGERIEVVVVYGPPASKLRGKLKPIKFRWRGKVYPIRQITLATDTKDGGVRRRFFSVVSGGNVYRICFNRENEDWILEEVWMEG